LVLFLFILGLCFLFTFFGFIFIYFGFIFYFRFYILVTFLSGLSLHRLGEVGAHEALEVEVGEHIILAELEEG
jgi:hypothetical protein